MDTMLGIFFIFALSFQNKFLENIIATSDDTAKAVSITKIFFGDEEKYLIFKSDPWL